jgi:hypothetical protein
MILCVTIEITAVEFRRLTSIEWAVLTLLNTFQNETPSIADASNQLSIGEPAFLLAALDNMLQAGAVQPRINEVRQLDLKDYEVSEAGKTILIEDGWELTNERVLTETFSLDWPSLRLVTVSPREKQGERALNAPSPDQVRENLTLENVQLWLDDRNNPVCWRVRNYYVSKVEA